MPKLFFALFISGILFSCGNENGGTSHDSLRKKALADSIRIADSLAKIQPGCNTELCSLLTGSADQKKIQNLLATNPELNCFCEFEGEYTKLGARIPIIKDFFKKKTRQYKYRNTPLQYATSIGDTVLMRLFLEAGASAELADSGQNRPIQIAFFHENEEAFNLLTRYGSDLKNSYIDPVFHSEEWLKRAAANGGDFNFPEREQIFDGVDSVTRMPVMRSTVKLALHQTWDYDKLKIMLESGARPNDTASGGKTLLHILMEWGSAADLDLALKYKADIYAKDAAGKTALHYAALRDEPDLLKKLLPLYDLKKAGITIPELIALAESEQKNECAAWLKKYKG